MIRNFNHTLNKPFGNHMLLTDKQFFKPSKDGRVLAILDYLHRDSGLSQNRLGQRTHLSGAMINQYLKGLQDEHLISFQPVNGKSYRYTLTKQGEQIRRNMFSAYASETIHIYTALKTLILEKLKPLSNKERADLVLFGAAETCEVVLTALRDTDVRIVAIVDNDARKHGEIFHGHVISPPEVLETIHCQAVVITSFGKQDEIYAQLEPIAQRKGLEVVGL